MAPKAAKGKAEEAPPPPPQTGNGKFYFKNGATYDGDWMKVPLPKPEGAELKPADAKVAGAAAATATDQPDATEFMRHGKGLYVDGKYKYSGEWLNDKMHGLGRFMYASGSYYDGQWDSSEYQGTGSFCWPDGRHYKGLWEHNRMHGQGIYTDGEGHQWSGQFFNGSGPGLTCLL